MMSHRAVVFIAPRFGTLTDRLADSFRAAYPDDQVFAYLYDESAYERTFGVLVSRILRVVVQVFPVPKTLRRSVESFVWRIRFRSAQMRLDTMKSLENCTCTSLVLVKPTYLSPQGLFELQDAVQAKQTSIVLWDALWRTPSVEALIPHADRVFTTEPSDAESRRLLEELPIPRTGKSPDTESHHLPSSPSSDLEFFHCGAWSADRFVAAIRLLRPIRAGGARLTILLVSSNPLVRLANGLFGFRSDPVSAELNTRLVGLCDVVVDLGRKGQSSPSERLLDAIAAGKVLLTNNSALAVYGPPIVVVGENLDRAVADCLRLLAAEEQRDRVASFWCSNPAVKRFSLGLDEWADRVLLRPKLYELQAAP